MNLKEIAKLAESHWSFDETNYPPLKGMSVEEKERFALRHVTLHLTKNVGALAAILEAQDHGLGFDREAATLALRKLIVNSLQFGGLADIPVEKIEDNITRWAKGEIK